MKYFYVNYITNKIVEIEIDRETEQSVFIRGRRGAKETSWERYAPDYDSCKTWLLNYHKSKIVGLQANLTHAKNELKEAIQQNP
jgi:hypothetical protein